MKETHQVAMSALYMWKLQHPRRRVVVELNAIATEGVEPPVVVHLLGSDEMSGFEGHGTSFPAAVNDALSKDGSGR